MFTHLQDVSGFAYCAGLLHAAFGLFHSGCDAFYFAIFLYIHTVSVLGFFFSFFLAVTVYGCEGRRSPLLFYGGMEHSHTHTHTHRVKRGACLHTRPSDHKQLSAVNHDFEPSFKSVKL